MIIRKLMIFVKFQTLNYVITYEIYVMGFVLNDHSRLDVSKYKCTRIFPKESDESLRGEGWVSLLNLGQVKMKQLLL